MDAHFLYDVLNLIRGYITTLYKQKTSSRFIGESQRWSIWTNNDLDMCYIHNWIFSSTIQESIIFRLKEKNITLTFYRAGSLEIQIEKHNEEIIYLSFDELQENSKKICRSLISFARSASQRSFKKARVVDAQTAPY